MILHIDMDAFYASVEQLDHPEYGGKCVIVGGKSGRGVVSAASYEARKFGVRSAMPMFEAKRKCPDAIIVSPRMSRYREVSDTIMSTLKAYSPLVEQVSIDEAYLDVTGCKRLHGTPYEIAIKIKAAIKTAVNLNCSIGIAPNKMLAKIASEMDKPDGLYIIEKERAPEFLKALPVRKVPGVGDKTGRHLEEMGIKTLCDIKKYPEQTIIQKLGKFGHRLLELSSGYDRSAVITSDDHKSISTEATFEQDTRDLTLLNNYLLMQAEEVSRELRKLRLRAKTVSIKIKEADFILKTRSITISSPTQSSDIIYAAAAGLLGNYSMIKKIRLIGIGITNFVSSGQPVQMELFGERKKDRQRLEALDKTVDIITEKFGEGAITRASLKK